MRTLVVVVLDDINKALAVQEGSPVVFLKVDDFDSLARLPLTHVTHLLFLGQKHSHAKMRHFVSIMADTGVTVTCVALPLGPGVITSLAFNVAGSDLDPGLMPFMVNQLSAMIWNAAWLPSVTKLVDPAPKLGQHLRSLLPGGSGYIAVLSPEPKVISVGAKGIEPRAPGRAEILFFGGADLSEDVLRAAQVISGASQVRSVPHMNVDPRGCLGHASSVEMYTWPAQGFVFPKTEGMNVRRCGNCAAIVPQQFCAYCHAHTLSMSLTGAPL